MNESAHFLFKVGSWLLISSGFLHLMSFLSEPVVADEAARTFWEYFYQHRDILPGGFKRSMGDLMNFFNAVPSIFSVFCGLANLHALKHWGHSEAFIHYTRINLAGWTVFMVVTSLFTFIIPIVIWGLAWTFFLAAFLWELQASSLK